MQANLSKSIKKIFVELNNINNYAKFIIKYGSQVFLALFALGTLMLVLNHSSHNFDTYKYFIATSMVKSSFIILAEVIIGGLLMDFFFRKA